MRKPAVLEEIERRNPPLPAGVDPRIPGFSKYLTNQVWTDYDAGLAEGGKHFGSGNADIAALLEAKKQRALGLNGAEVAMMRGRGNAGINQTMATGMRQLKGLQGASGLRGGAALGQALPILAKANMARGALESDIATADMERRASALKDYESTLTGERAGALGMGLGFAGLGSAERSNAMQHILGSDFIGMARAALGGGGSSGPGGPFGNGHTTIGVTPGAPKMQGVPLDNPVSGQPLIAQPGVKKKKAPGFWDPRGWM